MGSCASSVSVPEPAAPAPAADVTSAKESNTGRRTDRSDRKSSPSTGRNDNTKYQCCNHLLLVRPTGFYFNAESARDNSFQRDMTHASPADLARKAREEHAGLIAALRDGGVEVSEFVPTDLLDTPDALFPNNWFSTHTPPETKERLAVLYPMRHESRRLERRKELIDMLQARYAKIIDLRDYENDLQCLEGTGSLVLDRPHGVAYACLSERTHPEVLAQWARELGYQRVVSFSASSHGKPVYHTNVVMAVLRSIAVVCAEAVDSAQERDHLLKSLAEHRQVMQITRQQMERFCGNILEVESAANPGTTYIVMSTQAFDAFTVEQRQMLASHCGGEGRVIHVPFDVIETVGGGGVRCTLAELF